MTAKQFLELAKSTEPIKKTDYLKMAKLQEAFPFFLIPHVLSTQFEAARGVAEQSESLGLAAINSSDRIWLQQLLTGKADQSTRSEEEQDSGDLLPSSKNAKKPGLRTQSLRELDAHIKGTTPSPKPRRRRAKNDELIETIKKKDKKPISDSNLLEQRDLIKAFSKKSIKLATIKEIESNQNKENLAESSTNTNDKLISEPLAQLLVNQGKKDQAIEIYEKLLLKFPEKKAYFAHLIEKLKD